MKKAWWIIIVLAIIVILLLIFAFSNKYNIINISPLNKSFNNPDTNPVISGDNSCNSDSDCVIVCCGCMTENEKRNNGNTPCADSCAQPVCKCINNKCVNNYSPPNKLCTNDSDCPSGTTCFSSCNAPRFCRTQKELEDAKNAQCAPNM